MTQNEIQLQPFRDTYATYYPDDHEFAIEFVEKATSELISRHIMIIAAADLVEA